jgi:hypothetical protein
VEDRRRQYQQATFPGTPFSAPPFTPGPWVQPDPPPPRRAPPPTVMRCDAWTLAPLVVASLGTFFDQPAQAAPPRPLPPARQATPWTQAPATVTLGTFFNQPGPAMPPRVGRALYLESGGDSSAGAASGSIGFFNVDPPQRPQTSVKGRAWDPTPLPPMPAFPLASWFHAPPPLVPARAQAPRPGQAWTQAPLAAALGATGWEPSSAVQRQRTASARVDGGAWSPLTPPWLAPSHVAAVDQRPPLRSSPVPVQQPWTLTPQVVTLGATGWEPQSPGPRPRPTFPRVATGADLGTFVPPPTLGPSPIIQDARPPGPALRLPRVGAADTPLGPTILAPTGWEAGTPRPAAPAPRPRVEESQPPPTLVLPPAWGDGARRPQSLRTPLAEALWVLGPLSPPLGLAPTWPDTIRPPTPQQVAAAAPAWALPPAPLSPFEQPPFPRVPPVLRQRIELQQAPDVGDFMPPPVLAPWFDSPPALAAAPVRGRLPLAHDVPSWVARWAEPHVGRPGQRTKAETPSNRTNRTKARR